MVKCSKKIGGGQAGIIANNENRLTWWLSVGSELDVLGCNFTTIMMSCHPIYSNTPIYRKQQNPTKERRLKNDLARTPHPHPR
jgi:hypothetical protein